MTIGKILAEIMRRSGVDFRDGPPLYTYHPTVEDIDHLQDELRHLFRQRTLLWPPEAAGYCMFAAHYFCMHHAGGFWTWRDIHEAVGYDGSWSALYKIIRSGLKFLRREILTTEIRREFLVTLACEGGLPLRLVRDQNTHLRRYYKQLLVNRETYRDLDTLDLARRYQSDLPRTLRNDIVFELSAQLVDAIARLRERAGDAADPVEYLDQAYPNWRLEVPLRLDERVAEEFLTGLMREPRSAREEGRQIEVATLLHLMPAPRVWREASVPARLSLEGLSRQFGLRASELSPRMRFSLIEEDGKSHEIGVGTQIYREEAYSLETIAHQIEGWSRALRLGALAGSRRLMPVSVAGGDPLPQLPWVFLPERDHFRLAGVGSLRTRAEAVIIVLPRGAELNAEPDARILHHGELGDTAMQVLELRGTASIQSEEERSVIRTRSEDDDIRQYDIWGQQQTLGMGGSQVLVGVPSIYERTGDGGPRRVEDSRIQWRPAQSPRAAWRGLSEDCIGDVQLRVVDDGGTRFRARVQVLPGDFRMTLRAGRRAGEGDIELQNLPRPDISVRHNGSFDVSVEAEPRRAVLHLSGADEYPPVIEAWVRFPEERSCVLRLPFPAARRRFVRAAGARDLNGTRTTLDRLPGIWGSVMTPSQTADYRLEARFGGESVVVGRLELAASGALELSLERVMADVEDFLTSTADLDAVVELRIVRLGTEDPGPPPVLQVGRYDCQFEPQAADERGNREFGFDEENGNCLSAEELEALRVEACPMWNPLADAELVPIMDGGRWLLPVGEGRIGPWLVTGWIGDRLRVRPLLLTFGRDTTWNFERDIERAVTTEGFDARQAQLDRLLEAMADNPEHPDWEILEGFLEKLRTHSPSTFEIIVALTRHQRMMAQLALRLAGRALLRDFWAAMERLPFLWSSIPVSIWMEAGTRMQEFIARGVAIAAENDVNLDAKELFRNRVRNWSEGVRELFPAVEVLVEFISMRYPEVEPRECPISLSPATIDGFENDERNILLRTHADEWWPDRHPNEIRRIADLQDVELDDLLHPNPHDYQFAALNAPVVTAVACAYDRPVSSIPELRHIRHFDVAWFERAFAFTLARAIARRRENEPEFIDA